MREKINPIVTIIVSFVFFLLQLSLLSRLLDAAAFFW